MKLEEGGGDKTNRTCFTSLGESHSQSNLEELPRVAAPASTRPLLLVVTKVQHTAVVGLGSSSAQVTVGGDVFPSYYQVIAKILFYLFDKWRSNNI